MPDTFWTKFGSFVRSGATGQQQFACFGRSNSVADFVRSFKKVEQISIAIVKSKKLEPLQLFSLR